MKNETIWLYWEGAEIPAYYKLCQDSILKHNPTARIIGPEDLPDLIGDIPEVFKKAYITHKVDWLRKRLLFEQGGMYVDSDFICHKPLTPILSMCKDFDYVGYKMWDGRHMDNFFGCKAGSPIVETAADYALAQIERKLGKIQWFEASSDAIAAGFKAHKFQSLWTLLSTHHIVPKSGYEHAWFFKELESEEDIPKHHSFGYMTSVHSFGNKVRGKCREELLTMNNRLGHILRKGVL